MRTDRVQVIPAGSAPPHVLVTGASGFVGRHAVGALAQAGFRVRALVHKTEASKDLEAVELIRGSVTQKGVLATALEGVSCVVHLASRNLDADERLFQETNVTGTANLCEAAARTGPRRIIYLSSAGVYGHHGHSGVDESTRIAPDTPLSRSKAEAERILLAHHTSGAIEAVVLRPRFVYGSGDRHVIPRILRAMAGAPVLIGGGRAKLSFVGVRDLAAVIRHFVDPRLAQDANPVFNVSDGTPLSLKDVYRVLERIFMKPRRRVAIPAAPVYWAIRTKETVACACGISGAASSQAIAIKLLGRDNYLSNAKLCRLFPGLRFVSFEHGVRGAYDYYAAGKP